MDSRERSTRCLQSNASKLGSWQGSRHDDRDLSLNAYIVALLFQLKLPRLRLSSAKRAGLLFGPTEMTEHTLSRSRILARLPFLARGNLWSGRGAPCCWWPSPKGVVEPQSHGAKTFACLNKVFKAPVKGLEGFNQESRSRARSALRAREESREGRFDMRKRDGLPRSSASKPARPKPHSA